MEAVCLSENLVPVYKTTQCRKTEVHNIKIKLPWNPQFYTRVNVSVGSLELHMNLKAQLRNLLTPCDASAFRIKLYLELHKSLLKTTFLYLAVTTIEICGFQGAETLDCGLLSCDILPPFGLWHYIVFWVLTLRLQ